MADVFEFPARHAPRAHADGGMFALQGLDAGHLIGRHHTFALFEQGLRLKIELRDIGHFLIGGLIGLGIEPIPASRRLELGLIVKNARHGAQKSSRQSPV